MRWFVFLCLKFLGIIIPLIVIVALMSLLERKLIACVQRRRGPNVVGVFGLLQPIADAVKLFVKETLVPTVSNKRLFLLCPVFLMILTLLSWSVLPLSYGDVYSDVSSGILVTLVISSLSVYGIIMAGWSSNSKYAFLGGLRAAAQMISYEVGIGLYMLMGCGLMRSLNLTVISENQYYIWLAVPLHMVCVLLFISSLAETNRAPFDMAEAEAELVSGYNVEYSSMTFALFFIAEYGTILLMSVLLVLLFLGGWKCYIDSRVVYSLKVIIILALFILVRAALPRYRYDQLMSLGWKKLLPLGLGFVLFMGGLKFGALDLCAVTENI